MTESFVFQTKTNKFFTTHVVLFFTRQKIRLINPEISKTQVHYLSPIMGGGCHTTCKIEMCYGLIPL